MHFSDISIVPAVYEDVAAQYKRFEYEFDGADTAEERVEVLRRWDGLRKQLETWGALVHLRFNQDTRIEERKRARDAFDEMKPRLTELKLGFVRKLLQSPHRQELEKSLGRQIFALWEAEVTTFDPAIAFDLVNESKLTARYTELLASAEIEYRGEACNLSTMRKFAEHPDRDVRRGAEELVSDWFVANGGELDALFGELVALRTGMARKLGFKDFVELGYRKMSRTDYGPAEVERFRAAVREHLVPFGAAIREAQAKALGVDELRFWDEGVYDPRGNPAPQGGHDWMVVRAQEMFDSMGGGLDAFFRLMCERGLIDLETRQGKAGGGFCTGFPDHGVPFIFANFNGTKGDVEVFTHEMGHAFQSYMSRDQFPVEYLWPTAESCEIHSMSLEYLTWPYMDKFFGDDADRFRRIHLTSSLLFLPYGVAIDHFQHLVYASPDASPEERNAMWREMERTYLPWRRYGGQEQGERGAMWQRQLHVYLYPFYYVDYTLAEICALQFWVRSEADPAEALEAYVALCMRGGEAPFQELVRSADLVSPFSEGCLTDVLTKARAALLS